MKVKVIVAGLLIIASVSGYSQSAGVDSTNILKKQQKVLAVEKRLVDNKLKLEEMQKSLTLKSDAHQKSLNQSQESADKNKDAADNLQSNSDSKKDSRRADKAASQARRDAKRSRKAESRKNSVDDDIKSLQNKIDKDEKELGKLKSDVG
ncbi:MAG TPA: hypothetical protein VK616_13145 [Flavitalea sp.]|nr:hypothetical protein [Flavitalea sp.]